MGAPGAVGLEGPMANDKEFLDRLPPADLATLKARARVRRLARGEQAVAQEDQGDEVFFVESGKGVVALYSAQGKVIAFRDIGPGAIFGELSAIDGAPRSASVQAAESMEVLVLSRADFRDMVETVPGFAWALMSHLSNQMRRMTARVFEFSTMLARERVVAELLRLAELHAPGQSSAAIHPSPSHFDLAARISTHREAVSREMSRLAQEGLVKRVDGKLVIKDVEALRGQLPVV